MPEFCSSGKPSAGRPASMSFPPLCQSIALFSAPLTTPQHIIFRIDYSYSLETNARELKTQFFKDALLALTILTVCENTWGHVAPTELTKTFAQIEVQWQLQPTSIYLQTGFAKVSKWRTHLFLKYECTGIRLADSSRYEPAVLGLLSNMLQAARHVRIC